MNASIARLWKIAARVAVSATVIALIVGQGSRAISTRVMNASSSTVLPAHIRAPRAAAVVSEVPGTVIAVSVSPGDRVQAGQEIARLESTELAKALLEAQSRLDKAKAKLDASMANGLSARIHTEEFAAAQNSARMACARADEYDVSDLTRVQAAAVAKVTAVERLVSEHAATAAELSLCREEERNASRNLEAAREHRSRLQQECLTAKAQLRIAKMQSDLQQSRETEAARTEYDAAVAQVHAESSRQEKLVLRAQRSGTVFAVSITPGESVAPGSTIVQMGEVAELSVEVPVSTKVAQAVRNGDPVLVRLPLDPPREVPAKISGIVLSPGDRTSDYLIRVAVRNPDPQAILVGLEAAVVFPHSSQGR